MTQRKWSRPYLAVLGAPAIGEACAACGRPIAVGAWFRYTKGKDSTLPRGHLWRHVDCQADAQHAAVKAALERE